MSLQIVRNVCQPTLLWLQVRLKLLFTYAKRDLYCNLPICLAIYPPKFIYRTYPQLFIYQILQLMLIETFRKREKLVIYL